mgnify:CR=1 FL=1
MGIACIIWFTYTTVHFEMLRSLMYFWMFRNQSQRSNFTRHGNSFPVLFHNNTYATLLWKFWWKLFTWINDYLGYFPLVHGTIVWKWPIGKLLLQFHSKLTALIKILIQITEHIIHLIYAISISNWVASRWMIIFKEDFHFYRLLAN